MNILLTGKPKSGKTTLLKRLVDSLGLKKGFMAEEMRSDDGRTGFEVVRRGGKNAVLASVDSDSGIRVGKYGVEISGFENILEDLPELLPEDIFYLDEIGEMQLHSGKFKDIVREYLDKDNILIGTISAIYADDFVDEIKERDDVYVVTVTPENREEIFKFTLQLLNKIKKSKRYISEPRRFKMFDGRISLDSKHGNRTLVKKDGKWNCSCDFYGEYSICSHQIASNKLFPI